MVWAGEIGSATGNGDSVQPDAGRAVSHQAQNSQRSEIGMSMVERSLSEELPLAYAI